MGACFCEPLCGSEGGIRDVSSLVDFCPYQAPGVYMGVGMGFVGHEEDLSSQLTGAGGNDRGYGEMWGMRVALRRQGWYGEYR